MSIVMRSHSRASRQAANIFLANSRKIFVLTVLLGTLALAGGCKKKEATEQPHYQRPNLSDAEFRYGVAPTRNNKVTYQDDVIIVEHGEKAIHAVSSNGIGVTIDANLPEAQAMQPSKVVFLTNRAVGRILGAQRNGNELSLVLGPVDITEVIKEADLSHDESLDLNSMTAYSAPDFPGAEIEAPKLSGRNVAPGPRVQNAVAVSVISPTGEWSPLGRSHYAVSDAASQGRSDDPSAWTGKDIVAVRRLAASYPDGRAASSGLASMLQVPSLPNVPSVPGLPNAGQMPGLPSPPPIPGIPQIPINIGNFKLTPFCCGGIGIKIVHDTADVKVVAYGVIRLKNPSVHFDLVIKGGKVQKAGVTLAGAAGLTMQFEAGSAVGVNGNINKQITVPVDFSIPIMGLPVPVAVTFHQSFILKTAFSAKDSTLRATGDYTFAGSLFMGYQGGQWTVGAPTSFTVNQGLLNSIAGASVGVNGLVLAYNGKVIVGIGAFGFATGPYLGYTASIGISRGSDLAAGPMGLPTCLGATIDIGMSVGIGYIIPQAVTDTINFILRQLNVKEIEREGGLEHRENLIHKDEYLPESCGKP